MAKENNKLNMGSIQEIHALEQRIYDSIQDYVDGNYNAYDMLAIGKRRSKITMKADAKEATKGSKTTELYALKDLFRKDDVGEPEPDNDKIYDIVNKWMFLD